jgi:hypothetical protein
MEEAKAPGHPSDSWFGAPHGIAIWFDRAESMWMWQAFYNGTLVYTSHSPTLEGATNAAKEWTYKSIQE